MSGRQRYRAVMSRRASFLVVAASTLGFALVAWVSGAGSVQILQAPAATRPLPQLPGTSIDEQRGTFGPANRTRLTTDSGSAVDLTWVDVLLTAFLVSLALFGLVLLARWAWHSRRRWERQNRLPEVPFDVLPELSAALAKDAPTQLATLEEGSPRNAIVACWLRLEEVAAEAGVPRDPAETSTEFTKRVLGALAFDPAMIYGFAGLYREARFSEHELGEPARRAAIAALRSLYDDIAAPGIPLSHDVKGAQAR